MHQTRFSIIQIRGLLVVYFRKDDALVLHVLFNVEICTFTLLLNLNCSLPTWSKSMTQYPHRLIRLLVEAHDTVASLQLLFGVAIGKIYHSVLKHCYLLSVSLFNYCSVSSVMWVTWSTLVFSLDTLNMRWVRVSLSIDTLIFLCCLFLVRTFVKLHLRKVYVWSCVFLRFWPTNTDCAVCNFSLMTLCWRRKSRRSWICSHIIVLLIGNALWILRTGCRIILVFYEFATSASCW